ncbi:unnamed protein product [Trichobilharzia szidati]|nr:unnamed protein product [Trichobilharzia szidati]
MTEQIPFHRTSTIRHRSSRNGSIAPQDNVLPTTVPPGGGVSATGGVVVGGGGVGGIQQQSSVRRASIMQKYMGEIEFTGLNQTARVSYSLKR